MKAQLGQKAPLLAVSQWVQGEPVNFDRLTGKVVLVEVFQVNCPGCFLYSLPMAVELYHRYSDAGLVVLGVATAFEDFDKNNLENLMRLVNRSEVIGETRKMLERYGRSEDGRLPFQIPFPLAMDHLIPQEKTVTDAEIFDFIRERVPNFSNQPVSNQQKICRQVREYFKSLLFRAETFERFQLKGTPSQIIVDRQGILRECVFGDFPELENRIRALLEK
ncbi:MAG: TlpA family protein disulfide reductase [Gammaproteobacteria bacterium]